MKSLFVGAGMFIIFGMMLENSLIFILSQESMNVFVFWFISLLMMVIIEEGSRTITFKYILKNETKVDAITFGLGYASIEMIMITGFTLLSSWVFGMTFNHAGLETMLTGSNEIQKQTILQMVNEISGYGWVESISCIIERVSMFLMHIACSIFIYHVVRKNNQTWIYAFNFHFIMIILITLIQNQIMNVWLAEVMLVCVSMISIYLGVKIYKKDFSD